MTTYTNGNHPDAPPPGSAIYVDTENLRDSDYAQHTVAQIIADWPPDHPAVNGLSLYVRADKEALWRLWAETEYPTLRVRVRGVQHFTNNKAKNSADLAITADAIADLITGQANAVAVVSNDSDFGALFVKVREIARDTGADGDGVPFLWITVPDAGGLSAEIEQFIPARFRWNLSAEPAESAPASPASTPAAATKASSPQPSAKPARPAGNVGPQDGNEAIAEELIRQLPIGKFKVTDAHDAFRVRWAKHPAATGPAQFGTFLLNQIWPILQKRGVLMTRKSSPRTYEITQAAKDSIAKPKPKPATQTPNPEQSDSEPTPARIAATVAAAITDDLFSATAAQAAIKSAWPQHPAAKTTPQRFGLWFSEQLWPIMAQHGVVLAKEKPRRYEMTPDARHRLTSLA